MSQTTLITTRGDLLQIRKQQYIAAGYRIEDEQPSIRGMCSFRAVWPNSDEESNSLEELIWTQAVSSKERLNRSQKPTKTRRARKLNFQPVDLCPGAKAQPVPTVQQLVDAANQNLAVREYRHPHILGRVLE